MVRWDDVNYVSSPCNYFISLFPVNNILLSYIFILIPVSIHTYTHIVSLLYVFLFLLLIRFVSCALLSIT